MNSIIDPMWFYWIGVFNGLKIAFFVLAIIGLVAFGIISLWYIAEEARCPKWLKIGFIVCISLIIIAIFIPSESTMYKMMLAKYATYDNVETVITEITDTAVEIIQAIKE